tara:strand:+ start:1798 stop:2676 length:879 start_codon:yes stop_codon:yes gene_type:complete
MIKELIKSKLESHPNFYAGRLNKKNLFRSFTASPRILPDFIIIGEAKCGTTSLYNYMIQHPNIKSALTKEINYFNWNYEKSINWYKAHFPTTLEKKIKIRNKEAFLTGEATPLYLFHLSVPKRIFKLLPKLKIIICLRNPVNRAYSHYNDLGVRLGNDKRTFDEAVKLEMESIKKIDNLVGNSKYGFEDRLYQYVSRGIYLDHLKIWMKTFPKKQFFIVKTEELNKTPKVVLDNIFKFLSLPEFNEINIKERYNVSKYNSMSESTRNLLNNFFKIHNQRLEEYLKIKFNWNA